MDSMTEILFGDFPRSVGVTTPEWTENELTQYLVHSLQELQGVIETVNREHNLYSSISSFHPVKDDSGSYIGNAIRGDKVSFDFDSSAKAEEDSPAKWNHPLLDGHATDRAVVKAMRRDRDALDAVLGDVCYNAQELAEYCMEKDIPCFGVFSGFGLHVHLLHHPTMSRVGNKMLSTSKKLISELGLACSDPKASGRPYRIMRVPNVERICNDMDDVAGTGIYTIPLKRSELAEITPDELLDMSAYPRPRIGSEPNSRPEMRIQEEYLGPSDDENIGQEVMRPLPDEHFGEEMAQEIVKEITQMPCVWEHLLGRNPDNDVRVKGGIMFLNAGYSPEEATEVFSRLGWVDFDWDITLYQLRSLKKSGKGDWSCKTMQSKGLCARADEKEECPTYGYQGGNQP